MGKNKRAPKATPMTYGKNNDNQRDKQGNDKKEPQLIREAMQEAAKVDICPRSGEDSLMSIIAKHITKGGCK